MISFCILFSGAVAVTDGRFGKGVGPVYVGNVECQGTEMRLVDCNNVTTQALIGCHHGRDVGVLCEGMHIIFVTNVILVNCNLSCHSISTTSL